MKVRVQLLVITGIVSTAVCCWFAYGHVTRALRIAHPIIDVQPLPSTLIDLSSTLGQQLLKESLSKSDYEALQTHFKPQIYRSYCGVASGVMSVNALQRSKEINQADFFDGRPPNTRSAYRTFFGGMTLGDFESLMASYSLQAKRFHGSRITLDEFRKRVIDNLNNENDVLVINYARKSIGQKGGGHFSPVAAYHARTDQILVLDVAAHRYPPVWVKLARLWAAMDTKDSDSGLSRGFVEIKRPGL